MTGTVHEYAAGVRWDGNTGEGTAGYTSYSRRYGVRIEGKPELAGTADPAYRGEPDRHNPEDLFLSAIAACHMITYLAVCARRGVRIIGYEDEARGRLRAHAGGGGSFEEVTLRPCVTVADEADADLAVQLHATARAQCFIANSCSIPIRHEPTVRTA